MSCGIWHKDFSSRYIVNCEIKPLLTGFVGLAHPIDAQSDRNRNKWLVGRYYTTAEKASSPDPEIATRTQTTMVTCSKKRSFYLQSKQSSNKKGINFRRGQVQNNKQRI